MIESLDGDAYYGREGLPSMTKIRANLDQARPGPGPCLVLGLALGGDQARSGPGTRWDPGRVLGHTGPSARWCPGPTKAGPASS